MQRQEGGRGMYYVVFRLSDGLRHLIPITQFTGENILKGKEKETEMYLFHYNQLRSKNQEWDCIFVCLDSKDVMSL